MSDEIQIRRANLTPEGDLHFILSSWLKTYREEGKFTRRIRPSIFYAEHERAIKRILFECKANVIVACSKEEPDVILGYRVTGLLDTVLHWVFVRPEFRKEGICKLLLKDFALTECSFTHWTICMDPVIDRLLNENSKMAYNPYLF